MKRLPAFTLIEVLLSMLLVVLLGTFATIVLEGAMHDLGDQGRIAGQEQEELWLCQGIQADMDRSSRVQVDADGALVFVIEGEDVYYHLQDDHLVRTVEGENRDNSTPVHASSFLRSEDAPSLIRTWTLIIGTQDRPQRLTFRKAYDLQTIIRFRASDEHTSSQDH